VSQDSAGAGEEPQWDDIEDEGVLDSQDTLEDDPVGDPLDVGYQASDRWEGSNRYGTTPAEERAGESLDQLLAQEEPDVDPDADPSDDEDEVTRRGYEKDPRAGRLVADDEGIGPDDEPDSVADDVGIDSGAATAEEAAMHVEDDIDDPGDSPIR